MMSRHFGYFMLAIALGCGVAAAQQKNRPPAEPRNPTSPYAIAPAPAGASLVRGGGIQGYVFWPTNAAQYNHAAPCSPFRIRVTNRGSGTFHAEDDDLAYKGVIGGYEVCAYIVRNVPEGQDMHVLFMPPNPPFTPNLAFDVAPDDRQSPRFYVNIPGGACNKMVSMTPTVSELTTSAWWPCGDNAYDVNFGVYPSNVRTTVVSGPLRVAPGTPVSGAPAGPLLTPGGQTMLLRSKDPTVLGGAGGTNAGTFNPQPGALSPSGSGKSALPPVQSQQTGTKLVLPPNLKVFTIGEARNPAAVAMLSGGALASGSGGGGIGPEHTMSATGNGTGSTPPPQAVQTGSTGPGAMQPKSGSGGIGSLSASATSVCLGKPSLAAVNGGRFTQFTPGQHYVVTGCGFGSTPGKVYLSGPFQAHGGKIDLGPYWHFGTTRSWTAHWSDKVIDAQLDEGLSGELDEYNVVLVVETSTGQQIQMNDVSFKAQRAEAMLRSTPLGSTWSAPGFGTGVSPCGAWVTSNCTLEVLRNYLHNQPTPDTYTINLKPGFVLSRAVLFVMSQDKVTNAIAPQINGNQITVNWTWTTDQPTGFTYSLYGVQIFVVGPLGVTDAWAAR